MTLVFTRVVHVMAELSGQPSEPLSDGGSEDCACGGVTSSSRSPRFITTLPHGDRRRPGSGRGITRRTTRWRCGWILLPRWQAQCTMDVDEVPPARGSWSDRFIPVSGPHERVLRHTVEQIVDSVLGLLVLNAHLPQMVSGEVGDVLQPVGAAPSSGSVRSCLEPAAGVHQDLARVERARRRTAAEVARAYHAHSPAHRDELRSLRRTIWPDADPVGGGGTSPAQGAKQTLGTTLRRVATVLFVPEPTILEQFSGLQVVERLQEQGTVEFHEWLTSLETGTHIANCSENRGDSTVARASGRSSCDHAATSRFLRSVHRQSR